MTMKRKFVQLDENTVLKDVMRLKFNCHLDFTVTLKQRLSNCGGEVHQIQLQQCWNNMQTRVLYAEEYIKW